MRENWGVYDSVRDVLGWTVHGELGRTLSAGRVTRRRRWRVWGCRCNRDASPRGGVSSTLLSYPILPAAVVSRPSVTQLIILDDFSS